MKLYSVTLSLLFLTSATEASVPVCEDAASQPESVVRPLRELANYGPYRNLLKDDRLGTSLDDHQLAVSPSELILGLDGRSRNSRLNLDMPIYFIGVEKIGGNGFRHVEKFSCKGSHVDIDNMRKTAWSGINETVSRKAEAAICQVLDDPKPMMITHIARTPGIVSGVYSPPCTIFSVYGRSNSCSEPITTGDDASYDYDSVVSILSEVRRDIETSVARSRPTHILVMSTGWNTQQDESLLNYLDWLGTIQNAANERNESFRPLVVAFTWRSEWKSWRRSLGVVNKGNDADEIGMTWANMIINDVVLPVASDNSIPMALLGHSFGTRILGTALFNRQLIARNNDYLLTGRNPVSFVALQPAFPIQRFGTDGKEPIYVGATSLPILMVMTSSRHDLAASKLDDKPGTYAGGGGAPSRIRRNSSLSAIATANVDENGDFTSTIPTRGFLIAESESIVNCNMPNTGGGAHSDVYDKEMGRLIWSVIKRASE